MRPDHPGRLLRSQMPNRMTERGGGRDHFSRCAIAPSSSVKLVRAPSSAKATRSRQVVAVAGTNGLGGRPQGSCATDPEQGARPQLHPVVVTSGAGGRGMHHSRSMRSGPSAQQPDDGASSRSCTGGPSGTVAMTFNGTGPSGPGLGRVKSERRVRSDRIERINGRTDRSDQ